MLLKLPFCDVNFCLFDQQICKQIEIKNMHVIHSIIYKDLKYVNSKLKKNDNIFQGQCQGQRGEGQHI